MLYVPTSCFVHFISFLFAVFVMDQMKKKSACIWHHSINKISIESTYLLTSGDWPVNYILFLFFLLYLVTFYSNREREITPILLFCFYKFLSTLGNALQEFLTCYFTGTFFSSVYLFTIELTLATSLCYLYSRMKDIGPWCLHYHHTAMEESTRDLDMGALYTAKTWSMWL